MKPCIIRRVEFKLPVKQPGDKPRIVWAEILTESEGLALVIVQSLKVNEPHSIYVAQPNLDEHVLEPVGNFGFKLDTENVREAGRKLEKLGLSYWETEWLSRLLRRDEL